jgi:hypothetical protein
MQAFAVFTLHEMLGDQIREYEMHGISNKRWIRNVQNFVRTPEVKRELERPGNRWEDLSQSSLFHQSVCLTKEAKAHIGP